MSIIRFPTNARFTGEAMATRPGLIKRLWWRLVGHRMTRASRAKIILDRARRNGR